MPATAEDFRLHLEWSTSRPSPFVSFYTRWEAALRRMQLFREWKATEVQMYAVWIHNHEFVFDALQVAKILHVRKSLAFYRDEVLLLGGAVEPSPLPSSPSFPSSSTSPAEVLRSKGVSPEPYACYHLLSFDGFREQLDVPLYFGDGFDSRARRKLVPVLGELQNTSWVRWNDKMRHDRMAATG